VERCRNITPPDSNKIEAAIADEFVANEIVETAAFRKIRRRSVRSAMLSNGSDPQCFSERFLTVRKLKAIP